MATSLLSTITIIDEPLVINSGDVIIAETLIHLHSSQTPDGGLSLIRTPLSNITFASSTQCYVKRDPVILNSGILLNLGGNPDNILWLDA